MPQLEHIEAIERRLWGAADTLRANSNYASNEYLLPVMGLVFLRHAYSRYVAVKPEIEAGLPTRSGRARALTKEDFSQKNAIFLRPEAQFDHLVALPDGADRASAIIGAMESIENDYESLREMLPKSEYRELSNDVLGQLLRTLNPEELKQVSGDVFGRIYEYFLTQFADQKAHDGGEFFTPVSIVSLIAHVLDLDRGTVLDPACGSGGMFVQSARTVEEHGRSPTRRVTFRGLEKNATTIRLAKMNLAVHGLEGDIRQAITYYEDPHELVAKADYVMANPPFNVDEIDAEKVKSDPRLQFGLPGVNKLGKVSNGNYVWISYFHSYLSERGRAGFVMSSQASSAGRSEKTVRRKLIETGDMDLMIAIRSNFFYTRTVPCELWFLNRDKPESHRDKVLMLDARNVYRQVTRKICDFSPEQHRNLLAIVWLYRGETERFVDLVSDYLWSVVDEGKACFRFGTGDGQDPRPIPDYFDALSALQKAVRPFLDSLPSEGPHTDAVDRFERAKETFTETVGQLDTDIARAEQRWPSALDGTTSPGTLTEAYRPLAESSHARAKEADSLHRLALRLVATCEKECNAKSDENWSTRDVNRARKAVDQTRARAIAQLRLVHYYWRQADWLTSRFPDAQLRDVPGLVKVVDRNQIAANDWSLTPSRYVGVAPEEEDADFDFQAVLQEIHRELEELNAESLKLTARIRQNLEGAATLSWIDCELGDVLTLKRGYDLPTRQRQEGPVPVVSSSGITGYHNEAKVRSPAVVTGRYGTLGQVYYVDRDCWPLNTALYVVDFKKAHPRFAAYFLRNALGDYRSDKAAVPGVDRNVLHRLYVRVPDSSTQQAIASVLSAYDELIESNRRRIQLLERAARLLYREWFVHLRFPGHERTSIVNGLPEGWDTHRFDDICDTVGGGTPSTRVSEYWNGDITWVVPSDVTKNDGLVLLDSARKITESGLRDSSARLVPPNTILMTSRASVGYFALVPLESCTNQGFINIIPHSEYSRMYLLLNLMSRVDEIRNNAKGTTYAEISKGRFRQMEVVFPPKALLECFADVVGSNVRQIACLTRSNRLLTQARDLLLPRLMNGEIPV